MSRDWTPGSGCPTAEMSPGAIQIVRAGLEKLGWRVEVESDQRGRKLIWRPWKAED